MEAIQDQNSCTLLVSIFTITVSPPLGSLWSYRLRRLLQEGTVFQLRVLPYSISCLRVHQRRHTSHLESSQHRLHRRQSSFACLKPQQAGTTTYNHDFSHHRSHYTCRHACWAQLAPTLDQLPQSTSTSTHKSSRVQSASVASSSVVIRMSETTAGRHYRLQP